MILNYYFNEEFAGETTLKLLDFLNNCAMMRDEEGNYPSVNIYLNSPGGSVAEYQLIKDMLETSVLDITLTANYELSSSTFLLFYFTDNVNKKILDGCFATIHTADLHFSDRERRMGSDFSIKMTENLNKLNEIYYNKFKDYKILNPTQLKRFLKGDDIILLDEELRKIMKNCIFKK
jgi:ATP-dependent protease ClpP protease subunit